MSDNEEAMRLAEAMEALIPVTAKGTSYIEPESFRRNAPDLILRLARHVRRLVAANERMRKALEGIRQEAKRQDAEDRGRHDMHNGCLHNVDRIEGMAEEALTPTPAVEAKPAEKCLTCKGSKMVEYPRPTFDPCPDCTKEGSK